MCVCVVAQDGKTALDLGQDADDVKEALLTHRFSSEVGSLVHTSVFHFTSPSPSSFPPLPSFLLSLSLILDNRR